MSWEISGYITGFLKIASILGSIESLKKFEIIWYGYDLVNNILNSVFDELQQIQKHIENFKEAKELIVTLYINTKNMITSIKNWLSKRSAKSYPVIPTFVETNATKIAKTEDIYKILIDRKLCSVLCSPAEKRKNLIAAIESEFKLQNRVSNNRIDFVNIDSEIFHDFKKPYWYKSFIDTINKKCNLGCKWGQWQTQQIHQNEPPKNLYEPPKNLFIKYVEKYLINNPDIENVVIIFDEMEKIFKDTELDREFLDTIDEFYKKRNEHSNYNKLNFLFIGSATTEDYIPRSNEHICVGWAGCFDEDEKQLIAPETSGRFNNIDFKIILSRILKETNGLFWETQEIFHYIVQNEYRITQGREQEIITQLIEDCLEKIRS